MHSTAMHELFHIRFHIGAQFMYSPFVTDPVLEHDMEEQQKPVPGDPCGVTKNWAERSVHGDALQP